MSGDPNYAKSRLLVPGNGSNGSIIIPDLSIKAAPYWVAGSAVISTTQSKFNGSSIHLPANSYLLYRSGPIGFVGDCTIEFQVYPTSAGDSVFRRFIQSTYGYVLTIIRQSNTNKVQLLIGSNGGAAYTTLTCSTGFTANTWQHIAVCKVGNVITVYKDGVSIGSVANNSPVFMSVLEDDGVAIGSYTSTEQSPGYFAEINIMDGYAKYTAAFTPPAAPMVPYAGNLSGNLLESSNITKWDAIATSCIDGKVKGRSTETGSTYSINTSSLDPCLITVAPKFSYRWSKNRPAKVGDIVVAATPDTTPHLWECTAVNTSANYSSRALMLHFNGADGANAVYDSSSYQHAIDVDGPLTTVSAGATVGNACGYFPGNASIKVWQQANEFEFGTGNFSFRLKLTQTGGSTAYGIIEFRPSSASAVAPLLYMDAGVLTYYVSGAARITGSAIVVGTTYDIELSRVSGVTKLFVDGTQVGSSYTDANSYICSRSVLIGRLVDGSSYYFTGKMDELIISKGYADHSANFTPDNTEFASGDTGNTEPSWVLSGTTTDNDVTWTYIAPLVDPVTIGPKLPTV